MGSLNKKYVTDYKLAVILLLVWGFLFFWILKINGFGDFSAKYKIEFIQCYYQNSDSLLMIDGNKNSTWGIRGDIHFYEEPIVIKFREQRSVSSIVICNTSQYQNTSADLFASVDGAEYFKCHYTYSESEDGSITYNLYEPIFAQYILFSKTDENSTWPISEIIINE